MDHSELVQEMTLLEKMTAQDRLKHARKRRQQQLKNWLQREGQQLNNGTAITNGTTNINKSRHIPRKRVSVKFPQNVVLLEATARQDLEEVRQLLQSGKYNPNISNEDGLTPIHQCSIDNSDQLLNLLIEYGGDVNAKDRDLWTPLHAAATCGHLQICRILIENGAQLLALNADGNMPYDICDDELTLDYIETQMDRIGITQEMIDQTRSQLETQMAMDLQSLVKKRSQTSMRSIDEILSYRNAEGVTPLHIASANGYQTVVEYLLRQGVSINLQDTDGWTPLHAAAFWCQQNVIALLIEAGADINEKSPDGRSPLDLCDDANIREFMIDIRDQKRRNIEKAAAEAAAQLQQKIRTRLQINTNSLPNGTTSRTGTLYESRSSVSTPYGSGSSLNRTSSIRRASIRDQEKVKKLHDNFLEVLQAKDKTPEDTDEPAANKVNSNATVPLIKPPVKEEPPSSVSTGTESTVREPMISTKKSPAPVPVPAPAPAPTIEVTLPPLKVPPPAPPQATSDTLSDVKRRREERRRGVTNSTSIPPDSSLPDLTSKSTENLKPPPSKFSNGTQPTPIGSESTQRYTSPKQIQIKDYQTHDIDREKRICCTIL